MKNRTSRRDFARTLAAAGISTLVPVPVTAQSTAPTPSSQSTQETKASPQAEAMLQLLKAKFPDRLDQQQQKRALENFQGALRASERMSKADLKNSDEPDFIFSAGNREQWR